MTGIDQQIEAWLQGKEDEHLEFKEAKNNFHFDRFVMPRMGLTHKIQ